MRTSLVILCLVLAFKVNAATVVANSPSPTDMATAVAASANGDTIAVHAGVGTYNSIFSLGGKAVTVQPFGDGTPVFLWTIATGGGDPTVMSCLNAVGANRITGLTFSNSALNGGCAILIGGNTRVDHNTIYNGAFGVYSFGNTSLIDHNAFTNCFLGVRCYFDGIGLAAWNAYYPIAFTDINHFTTVENNTFAWTASYWHVGFGAVAISSGQGSSYIFRYNDLYNVIDQFAPVCDWHGDNNDGTYGNLNSQVYANNIHIGGVGSIDKTVDARGGNGLVYSNTVTGASGRGVAVREEWPLQFPVFINPHMLVTNMWTWANTQNGVFMPTFVDDATGLIVLNTEYFTNAPTPIPQPQYPHPWDTNANLRVAKVTNLHVGKTKVGP